MRNYSQYDMEMFNKVLLKVKTLLDQGNLRVLPEEQQNGKSRFIEFYNNSIRIFIEIITPPWGEEIWQVELFTISDRRLKYRGRGNVEGNATACEIYRAYKALSELPEPTIDEYVDSLFSC